MTTRKNLFRLVKTTSPHGTIRSAEATPDGEERGLREMARLFWDDFRTQPEKLRVFGELSPLATRGNPKQKRFEEIVFLLRPDINSVAEMGEEHVAEFIEYLHEHDPDGDIPFGGRHIREALEQMTRESFNRSQRLRGLLGRLVQRGVSIHPHFMEGFIADLAESIERRGTFPPELGPLFDEFLPIHMGLDGAPSLTEPVIAAAARRAAREGTFYSPPFAGHHPTGGELAAHLLGRGRDPFPRVADMIIRMGLVTGREGTTSGFRWIINGAEYLHQDGNLPESWERILRASGRLHDDPQG